MRRWIAAAAVLVAIGCESGTTGTNTTAGSGSGKAHCDELQTLGDKCCSQGFKDACGSVSKAFTDARCNESLDKLKNKCANFACSWSDDACFQ